MNPYVKNLIRISAGLEDPILGYDLESNARRLVVRQAVVNPGVRSWEKHVEETVAVLKSLDHELETALGEYDTAEEFAKFFEDGLVEEEELKKILDRTRELGKVASSRGAGLKDFFKGMLKKLKGEQEQDEADGIEPSYHLDESTIDDFVEGKAEWADASHYVQQEFSENRDFFSGAQDVLSEMEKIRKSPKKDALQKIRKQVQQLVRAGQNMLKGIRKHLLEPAPRVQIEEDEAAAAPAKDPMIGLESTVGHYVDMLKDSLEDPEKLVKYLKELFAQVKPLVEEERASLAARTEAQRRILPVLVRLAHARPHTRPVLLPIIRQATGR